jgi:hypothetical protein
MIATSIDQEDLDMLAEILEREIKLHRGKCRLCLGMFVVAFVALALALALIGVRLAADLIGGGGDLGDLASQFVLIQALAALSAVALSFFGAWWTAQNCLNSIERTLFAARNRRMKLFESFIGQIECAGKQKQRAWLEIVKSAVM